ncbi:Arginyl-tRNA--protein transferase [hydrothermal vent metagenome]|uniref:Arginyl-tRNA--protein transferase n=1 Tax=hydrothermal vent metagenome TaxID=652676 RepID=A0A3B0WDY9_9ZZZZ
MNSRHLQLYITTESPCSYFDDKESRNLVPDPELRLNMPIYNQLIQHGFRRSGRHCYRPHCDACQACVACRIPVHDFTPNRSQKRCLKANKNLTLTAVTASFSEEYFLLYQRYLNSRHTDGSMADPAQDDFQQFLYCQWSDTQFLEFRLEEKLVAIAVTDIVSDGISAVYSFFEPEMEKQSLGTYCVLKQIDYAKELRLNYVYLGYWIKDHPKMHYKNNFKPLQLYRDEQWNNSSIIKKPNV